MTNKPTRVAAALPKRFYTTVAIGEQPGGFGLLLDGRSVRTPAKSLLAVEDRGLAEAMAAEWSAQGDVIDAATMPLTRIVNTALDGVTGREGEIRDDIAKFAGSDLLCYRAEHPQELIDRQTDGWDPVLAWLVEATGARLRVTDGLMPVAQDPAEIAKVRAALDDLDALGLTALHIVTTLTGSAVLALALRCRRLDADAAWRLAHIDEDWQIEQWGTDDEAMERRAKREKEMMAAALVLLRA